MKRLLVILFILVCLVVEGQEQWQLNFDPIGGVYEKPTTVKLDAGEGATIYYTTDGTRPHTGSRKYSTPILVNNVSIIRAFAVKNGNRTELKTYTYVCDRKYDLPVISITTDSANLWNPATGIYVKGCCADTVEPYLGANYWQSWERTANIEMYDAEGQLCFNQQAGISIFGGFSRWLPQKSIAVIARSKYGDSKFRYPIFPNREHKSYKSFILRNSGGDFQRTHLRDAFMTQMAKPTGLAIQEYQPAVVFINGEYWGIQNIREKISEHYLEQNYGVDKDNVDILRQNGVKRHGSSANYKKLLAYLNTHDLSNDKNVDELRKFMDVDDFIRYNIAEVYSDNRDAGGNIRYWRERTDTSKWRWVYYDIDQGLGNNAPRGYERNTLLKFTSVNNESWPDPPWSTLIIRKLLENKKLEQQYINTFADHLNVYYHPDTANKLLDSMVNLIDYEIGFHQKRWGSSYENWKHQLGILRKFIDKRPYFCRQHLMQKFNLKDTVDVEIIHPGDEMCDILFNSLQLKQSFKGVYFEGVPVTITVNVHHDYEFVGWEDTEDRLPTRTITPDGNISLKPIVQPKRKSHFANQVIFNEIACYQLDGDSCGDWVELYNRSDKEIDISGWTFTERGYKNGWELPQDTRLPANGYLVLTENRDNFKSYYSADSVVAIGNFEFGLSSQGEGIKLYDAEGYIVDSLTYSVTLMEPLDSNFAIALKHPDSTGFWSSWIYERPSPSYMNDSYRSHLQHEADKRYWTKVFYIGGGSFFFILVGGVLFIRSYRKKHLNVQ
ncbi:MAG: CotH kinase family protein [Crocinitomicaceae bacterium]